MKTEKYPIPQGCQYITVESDVEGNSLCIHFDTCKPGTYYCNETECYEEQPVLGNLSIFWEDEDRASAIISLLKDWDRADDGVVYMAENGVSYKNAIRYRNEEQYAMILGKWPKSQRNSD